MSDRKILAELIEDRSIQLLFDPGEIDHVCDLLKNSPESISGGLRKFAIEPLSKLVDRMEGDSTLQQTATELLGFFQLIALAIDMNPANAPEFSGELERRWKDFVIAGTASHAYHYMPRDKARRTAAASRPRPNARNPIATAIREAMTPSQRAGRSFKEFMNAWETDAIDGLRLKETVTNTTYIVDDENGDFVARKYSLSTLRKMYSS